jgi:hypothetical protein
MEWTSKNIYSYNSSSNTDWLFLLKGKKNYLPQKIFPKYGKGDIYCGETYGISFGGCDIRIFDDSNVNLKSYSGLGHSYLPEGFKNKDLNAEKENEVKCMLAGSNNFRTVEIEVFN